MMILNFGQVVDVNKRKMCHQFTVSVDSGREVRTITTDENTIQQLIDLMSTDSEMREDESKCESALCESVFGGNYEEESNNYDEIPSKEPHNPVLGIVGEESVVRPSRVPSLGNSNSESGLKKRASAEKDDMGYVAQHSSEAYNEEEDGVQQL